MHIDHVTNEKGDPERDQNAENGGRAGNRARVTAVADAPVHPNKKGNDRNLKRKPEISPHEEQRTPEKRDETTGRFTEGNKYGRGRKGARNRLHAAFIVAAEEHWETQGHRAFDIVFKESPRDYLRIMASIMPKEFIIERSGIEEIDDDELNETIKLLRSERARLIETSGTDVGGGGSRGKAEARRKPTPLLPAISETE
jgi:hypothetical protein